jgi:gliding motility-associated-like protein
MFIVNCQNLTFAQLENNVWYFGTYAGIDFNTNPPIAIFNSGMSAYEGCSTLCDEEGNILFYTNGTAIYNKNHVIMQNGYGLLGAPSSTQSAIIVPKPETPNIYYVFTVDYQSEPDGFCYSIVDLTQDGGLGAVTAIKNVQLHTPATEKLTAVQHSNGKDIWIIIHDFNSNSFMSFLLSNAGITSSPVISNVGPSIGPFDTMAIGYLKVSPDNDKIVAINQYQDNQIYDFNNSTGMISNPVNIFTNNDMSGVTTYGCEFSPNGNFLYLIKNHSTGDFSELLQYDINSSTISTSFLTIATADKAFQWGVLQIAPDNRIYISVFDTTYLAVINEPNNLGVLCNFNPFGFSLGNKKAKLGLPQMNKMKYWYNPETIIEIPNVFTPNQDGNNDYFEPIQIKNADKIEIEILNRWGQIVYLKNDQEIKWDGTFNGNDCTDGVYFWNIKYHDSKGDQKQEHGFVELTR